MPSIRMQTLSKLNWRPRATNTGAGLAEATGCVQKVASVTLPSAALTVADTGSLEPKQLP